MPSEGCEEDENENEGLVNNDLSMANSLKSSSKRLPDWASFDLKQKSMADRKVSTR